MVTFFSGLFLGLSLIMAIGAQNAYILKQGLKKQYVFMLSSICALSDALLISFGVLGFGSVIEKFPAIESFTRIGGIIFLAVYALRSFYAALTKNEAMGEAEETKSASRVKAALICLAFTWLNPHVYLDTVILIGSISTQYSENLLEFTIGTISASFIFFFSLGYGSRYLSPLFKKSISWKILDFIIGIIMLSICIKLIFI